MATRESMNVDERYKLLRMVREEYHQADRKTKGEMLSQICRLTGWHRKYLLGLLGSPGPYRKPRARERSRTYGPDVEQAIAIIADTLDWICAERLKPALPKTARHLAKFGEMQVWPQLLAQLEQISVSTVRRTLKRIGRPANSLPRARSGRRADSVAQALVPVSVIPWQEPQPGHFEVDLVHHSRAGYDGPFACTIQFVDVLTGWSERLAILGYEFGAMWRAVHAFEQHCPIPVREIHTDNGPEFMNMSLISYFGEAMVGVNLTRGMPGHKNHNRFVEQKNGSLVRAYLGNLYLYRPQHVRMLNALYDEMWRYYNFFQPVLRQISRRARVDSNGVCHIQRQQDEAKTPLERLLLAKPPISRHRADTLRSLYEQTNPRTLKKGIHERLHRIYELAESDERRKALGLR